MPLFPSAYFPSIGYLKVLNKFQDAQIDLHENFVKQSIRNRCEILSANGKLKLIVPVKHDRSIKLTSGNIQIDYTDRWQIIHWRAIHAAYAHAPYFEAYEAEIKDCIFAKHNYLFEKNNVILKMIGTLLDISFERKFSEIYQATDAEDYRSYDFLNPAEETKIYQQVFSYNKPFEPNLSILDILFNEGPFARNWILTDQK
jgi:hypothetical protein